MNVFFYLILVLVATYPKVNEIKLLRKYIGRTTENGVEITSPSKNSLTENEKIIIY